jgi:hypothetical protein
LVSKKSENGLMLLAVVDREATADASPKPSYLLEADDEEWADLGRYSTKLFGRARQNLARRGRDYDLMLH